MERWNYLASLKKTTLRLVKLPHEGLKTGRACPAVNKLTHKLINNAIHLFRVYFCMKDYRTNLAY